MKMMKKFSFLGLILTLCSNQTLAAPDPTQRGEKIFRAKGCRGCHNIGTGPSKRCPDLKDVTKRRELTWLKEWIKDPRKKIEAKDPIAMEMLKTYSTKMPFLNLSDQEVEDVLKYIESKSTEQKK